MDNKDLPAFPMPAAANELGVYTTLDSNGGEKLAGLTKREYFTGLAMQALLANPVYHNPNEKHKMVGMRTLVKTAMHYADLQLEELNKPV